MTASTPQVVSEHADALKAMMGGLVEACQVFRAEPDKIIATVSEKYGLQPQDAKSWYEGVELCPAFVISEPALMRTLEVLKETGVLPPQVQASPNHLIDSRLCHLIHDVTGIKLYDKLELVEYLYRSLRHINKHKGAISFRDVLLYDQHHHGGVKALEECAKLLSINDKSRVLNVGSGLGGPARYLAGQFGCEVTAVELQRSLHVAAQELTGRCESEVSSRVHHIGLDFNLAAFALPKGSFSAIVAWLTFLHFPRPDRLEAFKRCAELLSEGGQVLLEDFVSLAPLSQAEKDQLQESVFCRYDLGFD